MTVPASLRALAIAAAVAALVGCTNVQVPGGSVPRLEGRYVVLGVVNRENRVAVTASTPSESRGFPVPFGFTVDAPAGTQAVVPTLTGWALGYGEGQDPVEEAGSDRPDLLWQSRSDAYLGLAQADVTVIGIRAADAAAGRPLPQASIRATLRLSDFWQDKPWWGVIRYQLIFLGCADGGTMSC